MAKTRKPTKAKKGSGKGAAQYNIGRFIEELLRNGGNQTQAAIAIGVPKRGAATWACKRLKQTDVSDLLKKRREEAIIATHLDTNEVLESLARSVRFDPRKLFNADGTQKEIHELDDDTALCIQAFEISVSERAVGKAADNRINTKRQIKVRAADRNQARDQALKVLNLYKEQPLPPAPKDADLDLTDAMRRVMFVIQANMLAVKGKK